MASDFDAALNRLTKKLVNDIPKKAQAAVRDTLAREADLIVAEMKRFAPVQSGDLQMSISWCWGNAPKGTMTLGHVGVPGKKSRTPVKQSDTNKDWRITIYAGGDDEYYSWFVEFGTENMDAQPFFYPIWRKNKRRAKARITRAVAAGVKNGAS